MHRRKNTESGGSSFRQADGAMAAIIVSAIIGSGNSVYHVDGHCQGHEELRKAFRKNKRAGA